ncbi:MAG: hypothetical protein ABWW69_05135 [Pyrodictiaceae archaeon]
MPGLRRLVGFRYAIIGLVLLVAALVLLVVADTPLVSRIEQEGPNSIVLMPKGQTSIRVGSRHAGTANRDYFLELNMTSSSPIELVVGGYGFSTRVQVSGVKSSLVYVPGVPAEILVACMNCSKPTTLYYSYGIYLVSRPYFILLYPAIAFMITGFALSIIGTAYIVLEAKITPRGERKG